MTVRRSASAMVVVLATVLGACSGAPAPGASAGTGGPATSGAASAAATGPTASAAKPSLAPGVTAVIDPPFSASAILAHGELLWAEDHAKTGKVFAIDPESGEVVHTVEARRPCDLAVLDDRIWFADVDASMVVGVDPDSGETVQEVRDLYGVCGVQAGDGVLWAAVGKGLVRIDPNDGSVTTTDLGGAAFPGAAFPAAGAPVWATLYDSKELVRVDAETGKELDRIPPPGGASYDLPLAVAFDSLWAGIGDVYRLDPETGDVQQQITSGGASRFLVTDDSVWFTNYPAGSVSRIDVATNEVVYRTRLGGNPNGITEGWGSIWVSDTLSGNLYRIDPGAAVGLPG